LGRLINIAGNIWNHCIALHKRYYGLYGKHLKANDLKIHITKLKNPKELKKHEGLKKPNKYAFWNKLGSQAIQDVVERIDRAYTKFFSDRKRGIRSSPPKFRKVRRYSSITLKQAGWKLLEGNRLLITGWEFQKDNRFKKLKREYRYFKSREIEGKPKTLTIKRDALGDLWLFIVTDQEFKPDPVAPGKIGGLDFGLKTFLTDQDGNRIESPRFMLKASAKIKAKSRKMSRKRKATKTVPESGRRKRARQDLIRTYRKTANQRADFHWKIACSLARGHRVLSVEDLCLKGMQRLWGRKMSDLGHGEFLKKLEWECLKEGCGFVKIDRFYPSSKTCSACGHVLDKLDLKTRAWTCPDCGAAHNRDHNAAKNIAREGASSLGGGDVRPA
jgi:putative transposase